MTMKTTRQLLGISLAIVMVLGSVPLGFSEPLRVQLEQGIEIDQIQCNNSNHVLVLRTNGNVACVTETSAEKMNWEIISDLVKIDLNEEITSSSNEIVEISDERIIVYSEDQEKFRTIASAASDWPHATFDIPTQVKMGEPFDIKVTYQWFEYDFNELTGEFEIDDDTGEFEILTRITEDEFTNRPGHSIKFTAEIRTQVVTGTQLLSDDFIQGLSTTETWGLGFGNEQTIYRHELPFDNSNVQEKIITYQIDEIVENYNLLTVGISSLYPDIQLYLYEDILGTVTITQEYRVIERGDDWEFEQIMAYIEAEKQYNIENGITMPLVVVEPPTEEELQRQQDHLDGKDTKFVDSMAEYFTLYPVDDIPEFMFNEGYTQAFLDVLFERHPELKTQSFIPVLDWILPLAFGQTPNQPMQVSGNFFLNDINGKAIPGVGIKVCAFEYDAPNIFTGQKFNGFDYCDVTDDAGFFKMFPPRIDMDDPRSNPDVKVVFTLEKANKFKILDSKVDQLPNPNEEIVLKVFTASDTKASIPASIAHFGNITPSASGNFQDDSLSRLSDANMIFQTLDKGWNYFNDKHSYKVPFVNVEWGFEDGESRTFHDEKTNTIELNNFIGGRTGYVVSDAHSPQTVLHEYGHKVQHSVYGLTTSQDLPEPKTGCGQHNVGKLIPVECAWVEGFANYVAAAVTSDSTLEFSTFSLPINLETGKYATTSSGTGGTVFPGFGNFIGEQNEGWVASALWDIHDNTSESGDDIDQLRTDLWDALSDTRETKSGVPEEFPASTFLDFVDDWNENKSKDLASILNLNKITKSVIPPSCTPEVSNGFVFFDHFTCDLSKWTESGGNEMWEVKVPDERQRTGMSADNNVANAAGCVVSGVAEPCNLTMTDSINLSGKSSASIEFWRYLDSSLDFRNGVDEGLRLEVSTDGTNWTELGKWTKNTGKANDTWTKETVSLNGYLRDDVKLRFVAISDRENEEVEIDDILIRASTSGGGGGCGSNCPTDPNGDDDSDGIANNIDKGRKRFSNTFSDGTTSGEITARGGQIFTISDASGSEGVNISTKSSPTSNEISTITLCGDKAKLSMNNGDSVTATCGSVILEAKSTKSFGVVFTDDNGKTFSTRLSDTDKITFDETIPSLSTTGATNSLQITINGERVSLSGGSLISPPSKITNLTGEQSNDSVILSWSAPNNGGVVINDYLIQYKKSSDTNWITFNDGVSSSTGATVTGLEITSYDFKVAPKNPMGTADYSNPSTVTLIVINSAPILDTISNQSADSGDTLSFTVTATDSDVPSQTLTFSLSGTIPTGATITSSGEFTWTPTESQVGTHNITFEVTDSMSATHSQVVSFNIIKVILGPDAPVITTSSGILEETREGYWVRGTSESGVEIILYLNGEPVRERVSTDDNWSFTTQLYQGDNVITATATDSDGLISPHSEPITLTIPSAENFTLHVEGNNRFIGSGSLGWTGWDDSRILVVLHNYDGLSTTFLGYTITENTSSSFDFDFTVGSWGLKNGNSYKIQIITMDEYQKQIWVTLKAY